VPPIPADDPLGVDLERAIHDGDVDALEALLAEHPELAVSQIADGSDNGRTCLHIAADWPGHFPNGPAVVSALVAAGADVDARGTGAIGETPLQWAASSDDVAVLDALLDAGAEIEAAGAGIAGGTALENAVAYGQWNAARRLVERGAAVTFRQAAALGLMDVVVEYADTAAKDELSMAFWYACHGGRLEPAEYLLARGADRDWVAPWDRLTPLGAAERSEATAVAAWLRAQGAGSGGEG
jgi:uncharacterized protein